MSEQTTTETDETDSDVTGNDSEPVEMPPQVHCELKTLRQMGTHDVRSTDVIDGLETYDFHAALAWVLENPGKYERAVLGGTSGERTDGDS